MKKVIAIWMLFALLLSCVGEAPAASAAVCKTKKQIYRVMSKNFLARKKSFSVSCTGKAASSIIKRLNSTSESKYYSVLFEMSQAFDKKKTTDDGDYLYAMLGQVYCYYSNGKLHFYGVDYFETAKQTKKVNKKVKKVAKAIAAKAKSNYEKIAAAYAYVIDRVTYDSRENCFYSAYAGFYKRKTVCNGYAMMLYKLLMQMGIKTKFVSGKLKDGKKWYLHAWNLVKLKGKWYNLDACSDDADDGNVYTDYFLKCDKTISDHKKDTFYQTKTFKKKYPMSKKDYEEKAA